ncbi:MAG: amidohydrolase family protein [Spirochaetes bacterium]|nr:amidohydrolase family protein [Spirochaetota bacterium]
MKTLDIPLLHDNHSHTSLYASLIGCTDLSGMDSDSARRFLEGCPRDHLTVVRGLRSNSLELTPSCLATLPPVLVINFSLHGFALSDSALGFLGSAIPGMGERRFDRVWSEANLPRLFSFYGALAGLTIEKLGIFMDSVKEFGIGSVEDMTVTCREAFDLISSSPYAERVPAWAASDTVPSLGPAPSLRGVKFFLDGSLGARTAALSEGFIGPWNPVMTYTDGELLERARDAASFKALSFHAIGDLAVWQAIRVAESMRGDSFNGEIRFEHVQFITPDQARRCRDAGVKLSMQPNFSSDSVDYADRLAERLCTANDPFRMLIDEAGYVPGETLVFGSDGMPHGVPAAFTASLFPAYPGQRLSLDELLAGYGTARGVIGKTRIRIDGERRSVEILR